MAAVRFPAEVATFLHSTASGTALGHPASHPMGTGGALSPGAKEPGHGANNSFPYRGQ
jgi:hypothetical protein